MKTPRSTHLQLVSSNSIDHGRQGAPTRTHAFDELRLLSQEARELCVALSTTLSHLNQLDRDAADSIIIGELLSLRDGRGIGFRNVSPRLIWERLRHFIPIRTGFRFDLKPNGLPNIVRCHCAKRTIEIAQIQTLGHRHQEYGQFYLERDGQIWGMCATCITRERTIAKRKRHFGRNVQDPHFVSYARADLHRHRKLKRERLHRRRHTGKSAVKKMRKAYPFSFHMRTLVLMKP